MVVRESVLNNTTMSATDILSPQEAALQALCKQLLKSRIFRGFYEERRYVEEVKGYRDIVSLHRSEKDLNKLVKDIRDKLQLFYNYQNPNTWIGVTSGTLTSSTPPAAALDTYIWAEFDDLAFGQYWFIVKSLKFRNSEVILRLKVVRSVEAEELHEHYPTTSSFTPRKSGATRTMPEEGDTTEPDSTDNTNRATNESTTNLQNQVNLKDFAELIEQWWSSIKHTTYEFLSNDINKDNIKGFLRFMGLLLVSLISAAFVALKFLGNFSLRFMLELSRFTHVSTPIIIKLIDILNKMVGGLYILLAMIWKDTIGNRFQQPKQHVAALGYNQPMYKTIQYNIRNKRPNKDL